METINAIIKEVRIEIEDHGFLTAWLFLDYGNGAHQGFGGYRLSNIDLITYEQKGNAFGSDFILNCLKVGDVNNWTDLKSKSIRVVIEENLIKEIGHITKDIWFNPKKTFKTYKQILGENDVK